MDRKTSHEDEWWSIFCDIKREYIEKKGRKQTKKEVLQQEEDEEDEGLDIFSMPPSNSKACKNTYLSLKGSRERRWRLDALRMEDS